MEERGVVAIIMHAQNEGWRSSLTTDVIDF